MTFDYTPKKPQAEIHVTYRCDCACTNCNRACFLPPQTADMTLDDAREFVRQAEALPWHPRVLLIGGEPTLHPQFLEFVPIFKELGTEIQVWSNGFTAESRALCEQAEKLGCFIERGTWKPGGSMNHGINDWFVAPSDYGKSRDKPCACHAGYEAGCGISVDAAGYAPCCCGGSVDGFLRLAARTMRLTDLFDPTKAELMTRILCSNCGRAWPEAEAIIKTLPTVRGAPMSPRWEAAAKMAIKEQH